MYKVRTKSTVNDRHIYPIHFKREALYFVQLSSFYVIPTIVTIPSYH